MSAFRNFARRIGQIATILTLASSTGPSQAQFPPSDVPPAAQRQPISTSQASPASRPGEFQPGVSIDWNSREVRIRARIAQRVGPLEFLACRVGKEHESLLLLDADANHIFMAMGLIGLEPGTPPRWDEKSQKMNAATGALVDLQFRWTTDGQTRSTRWNEWLLDAEFLRPPISRPLVFAGSVVLPNRMIACEKSGAVFALVDMPDALVSPTRSRSDREADLWAIANAQVIPPIGTEVELIVSSAAERPVNFELNRNGQTSLNGRYERVEDFVELLKIQHRLSAKTPIVIRVESPLVSDQWQLAELIKTAGLPDGTIRFERTADLPEQSK